MMSDEIPAPKALGGIAPFGYAWQRGALVVDPAEAPTRRLIYELFIKHRRKKTVAKLLNDLGYRTRGGAPFSDTTIDRLLRDPTAKGIKIAGGVETAVEAIISTELWERANNFLGSPQTKLSVHLFTDFAFCDCGGKMTVPSNAAKYVCEGCRRRIVADDLEAVFVSQLAGVNLSAVSNEASDSDHTLSDLWQYLTAKEKRILIEQMLDRITIGSTDITIKFSYFPNALKTTAFEQQNETGNETPQVAAKPPEQPTMTEPLMNEIEAARFLGISRMTLLRKRNASEIGFFRVGFRVLYSKEKHLLPFLQTCEK